MKERQKKGLAKNSESREGWENCRSLGVTQWRRLRNNWAGKQGPHKEEKHGERVLYPKGGGKPFKTAMYEINKLQGCIIHYQGIQPIFSKTLNGV